jgi:hypothetical protein
VPYGPLWTWNVLGDDVQYFSQTTVIWDGSAMVPIRGNGSCVARCTSHVWTSEPEGRHKTHPIQCGQVAGIDAHGRYLCDWHWHCAWECRHCYASLPHGEGGYCSAACRDAAHGLGPY